MFVTHLSFVIVLLICYFIYYYLSKKNLFWKVRGVPGPKPELLFGNIKMAALRKQNMSATIKEIYDSFPNESIVGFYRMTAPCILIRDLDIIKHVMIKDFDKFEDRGVEFSKEGFGANLFHADGETWRVLRNKFTPLFTTGKLKNMVYLINDRADFIMDYFDNIMSSGHQVVEISTVFKRFAISAITTCIFGLNMDTIDDSLISTLLKIDKLTLHCNIFHEIDMMFPGLLKKLNTSLFPTDVQTFFQNMVKEVIDKRNGVPSGRNDFIDLILEMRNERNLTLRKEKAGESKEFNLEITDSMIAAQILVFFMAGYETSSSILSILAYEIAKIPSIQDKLIEEVDSVLKKYNGNITYDTLREIPYIEKVFHEVYRKYPIVPLQRKVNVDYKIRGTEYTIEKDSMVIVSALGIHYDENIYPDPEKFDPERFSQENINNRHPCAFLSYGVGPRNCIGIRFGQIQTRIFLLKFLSKYRFEPSEKTKILVADPSRIVNSPTHGIYLNVIPRKFKKL